MSNRDSLDRRGRPEHRDPRRRPVKPHGRRPHTAGEKPAGKGHLANRSRAETSGPRTDWSGVAEWYDRLVGEEGSEYHREVVHPGTLRLLALQPGDPVVDVASGQGAFARLLQSRGAEVTGVDAAEPLVRAARERGPDSIRYHVGDARDLSFLPEGRFAAAACVLAIQNMHPIAPVFQSVARLLRIGGRFVMVMMHPCFRGPKETMWGWDPDKGVQFRRVDRYLLPRKTPIVTHPGSAPDVYTWTFHKPIEAYVRALRNAGLLIDAIEEWPSHKTSEPGPRAGAENTARKEIPMFMAIRAVKVAPAGNLPRTDAGARGGASTDGTTTSEE
jgi:ubiquinone/menaquinone biosynthesis C-methylase UbiE